MSRTSRFQTTILGAVLGAVACGLAVLVARPIERDLPEIRYRKWHIERPSSMPPLKVRPQLAREFIERYRDMKMTMQVILEENAELDIVFHWVQKWKPKDGEAQPPFHSRFSLLRLSTFREGKPLLSRDDALFGDGSGGVSVKAGAPATVLLETKGRMVRGNVAGVEIPWTEVSDDHGMVGLVARGGEATVQVMEIQPLPIPDRLLPHGWAAILGAIGGLLVGLIGRRGWVRSGVALLAVLAGGAVARWLLPVDAYLVGVPGTLLGTLCASLCGVPTALGVTLLPGRVGAFLGLGLGVLGGLASLEAAVRQDKPMLRTMQSPRLRLMFGAESGPRPFDALAQRISREYRVSGWRKEGYDVLLLGSRHFFDVADPAKNLTRQVQGLLTDTLRRPVACTTTSTMTSNALQQFLLFREFYYDFRPKVVVLGLDAGEMDEEFATPVRQLRDRLEAEESAPPAGSLLQVAQHWRATRTKRVPASDSKDLAKTLQELHELCTQEKASLILALNRDLPDEHVAAVQAVARQHKLPVVEGFDIWQPQYPAAALAAAIAKTLRAQGR